MKNILLLGGSGLLGKELQKRMKVDAPSHSAFDITSFLPTYPCDMVIHAAAYTDVVKAEKDRLGCYEANVFGTYNLVSMYKDIPFVLISTEYVKNPVNVYSRSKLIAETIVRDLCNKYLIIRTLFKPYPFPWDKAFTDQFTTGDFVNVIAPLIVNAINKWDKKTKYVVEIGTGRKTIYDLAKRSNPKVKKCSIKDVKGVKLPSDYQ